MGMVKGYEDTEWSPPRKPPSGFLAIQPKKKPKGKATMLDSQPPFLQLASGLSCPSSLVHGAAQSRDGRHGKGVTRQGHRSFGTRRRNGAGMNVMVVKLSLLPDQSPSGGIHSDRGASAAFEVSSEEDEIRWYCGDSGQLPASACVPMSNNTSPVPLPDCAIVGGGDTNNYCLTASFPDAALVHEVHDGPGIDAICEWGCKACTFLNASADTECIVCDTPKEGEARARPYEGTLILTTVVHRWQQWCKSLLTDQFAQSQTRSWKIQSFAVMVTAMTGRASSDGWQQTILAQCIDRSRARIHECCPKPRIEESDSRVDSKALKCAWARAKQF